MRSLGIKSTLALLAQRDAVQATEMFPTVSLGLIPRAVVRQGMERRGSFIAMHLFQS